MAAFLEAIKKTIIEAGEGVEPTPDASTDRGVYIDRMPPEVRGGILLINRLSGSIRFPEAQGYRKTLFHLVFRGTDNLETKKWAFRVTKLMDLTAYPTNEIHGVLFHELYVQTDPTTYPVSEGDYWEFLSQIRVSYGSDGTYT